MNVKALGRMVRTSLWLCGLLCGVAWPTMAADFDVQAHQGGAGLAPGNTLPAFEKALALRVTTLELDVQASRDRVLFLHHDVWPAGCVDATGRKLGKRRPFLRYDATELDDVRCDWGHRRPARLDEVLRLARAAPYRVQVSVEIKFKGTENSLPPRESARLVLEALERHGLESRAIVQSFSSEVLLAVRELDPDVRRAYLVRWPWRYGRVIDDDLGGILSPRASLLCRRRVRRYQERGIAVIPWTVDRPRRIHKLIDWGVDGIMTNRPDIVLEILADEGPVKKASRGPR